MSENRSNADTRGSGRRAGDPGLARAVFADGPVAGRTVLVHGALGAVSSLAAQLAVRDGADVVSTVRRTGGLAELPERLRGRAVALDRPDPAAAICALAPEGVDRVVEVSFPDNVDLDATVIRNGAVIAAYATRQDRPSFDFCPMLFDNVTIRLLGSDDLPGQARQQAAVDLTAAAAAGDLVIPVRDPFTLEAAAEAHDQVDADNRRRVLLAISQERAGRA